MKKYNDASRSRRQGETLTTRSRPRCGRCYPRLYILTTGLAQAQTPTPVNVPDKSFPESVTATSDGALYVGSFNHGGVTRVTPTGKVDAFISPGANGSGSTLGALADEKRVRSMLARIISQVSASPQPGERQGCLSEDVRLAHGRAQRQLRAQGRKVILQ